MAINIEIGGRVFRARPFSLANLQKILPVIYGLTASLADPQNVENLLLVIRLGLVEIDPSELSWFSLAMRFVFRRRANSRWFKANLDARLILAAIDEILAANGIARKKPGEAPSP